MQAMAGGVSGKELGYVIQKRDLWARVIALKRREVGVSVRVRPETTAAGLTGNAEVSVL